MTRRAEDVVPLEGNHIRMYTCGPTVYNYAHIGNYRAYMFEDLLRRHLKYNGFEVTQVMNLTDVDDKTIRGAREAGVSLDDYTRPYKEAFFDDLKMLSIEPAEHYPAATDHIPEMIALIEVLFEHGYAYKSDDGSVYYSIAKFKDYGKLAHLDMSGLRAGARVTHDEYEKDDLADFALWKAYVEEDGDVAWDSPWGRGRPGWHIECSAMSQKYLGETFDIHTGGVDNIFPHHEDEIAQSEGASGKTFVRLWAHCAHLMVEGRKMAKSYGNFYTLRDVCEKGYSGREIRYVLISGHYRQSLNFTFDALDAAKVTLGRIDEFTRRLKDVVADSAAGELPAWAATAAAAFKAGLDDDLNIAESLAALFDMTHAGNRAMDSGELSPGGAAAVVDLLTDFDRVLGVLAHVEEQAGEDVRALLDRRAAARAARDWAESDRIRDALAEQGWIVRDTPEGQKVVRKQ